MSTLGQPHPEPAWKQEVARRLAAHKNRKGTPTQEEPSHEAHFGNSMAAQAAARVAARYAKAPSYSQMQAEEARLAVRAAEIATEVALQAQAAAEEALAELHAAASEKQRGPAVVESIDRGRMEAAEEASIATAEATAAEPETFFETAVEVAPEPIAAEQPVVLIPAPEPVITQQVVDGQTFGLRWEPDAPVRVFQPRPAPTPEPLDLETEDWWTPAQVNDTLRNEPISVETQAGSANLIQFPREIVATRKMRPRLAEPAQAASATERQLSIFEVDPDSISTEPAAAQPAASMPSWSDPAWSAVSASSEAWSAPQVSGARWSGMELDEHPLVQERPEPAPARAPQQIVLAPFGRRLMAVMVDGCLILGTFFAAAMMMAARMQQPLSMHSAEAFVVVGLVLVGFLYNAAFLAAGAITPGMRYAGIALSTFDDELPTGAQLRRRLGAMVLSLAPVGLGLAWAVFDDDHLSWHDRMSQTYLRKR